MKSWSSVALPEISGVGLAPFLNDVASGKKINPVVDAKASIYICGITPYDSTHIGHAATYVNFDLLKRVWLDAGFSVNHVQNVTDIDDPLFERATKIGTPWQEIANREMKRYADDMVALRVLPPDSYATITEEFSTIVTSIQELLHMDAAYRLDDDIYFDISQSDKLGFVSHLKFDEMKQLFAARGGDPERANKRNALDPLLWKQCLGDDGFDSVLGKGRPGWHVECVAIANKYAALPLSVKAGGSDLIFPHHDMCQAECDSWLHVGLANAYIYAGMVNYQGEKMSKSLGNLVFVSDLLESGVDPMAIRLAILTNHYSKEWHWSDDLLTNANLRLETWRDALALEVTVEPEALLGDIRHFLADDLDTPSAISAIDTWATNTLQGKGNTHGGAGLVGRSLDKLFGIAL
jgi:L-cysteine:1D-myo-inositol 2-amino-2-deoxy-alpha-D-glucopyranoside ligase